MSLFELIKKRNLSADIAQRIGITARHLRSRILATERESGYYQYKAFSDEEIYRIKYLVKAILIEDLDKIQ